MSQVVLDNTENIQSREHFDVALMERLLPKLAAIARNSIGRQWQAKVAISDIVQETFFEATQTLPAFAGSTIGEFNEWLRAILKHNLLDARRKYTHVQMRTVERERSLSQSSTQYLPHRDPSPSYLAEVNEFDGELHRAIQSLAPIDRQIVNLRYQQNLTFLEIGKSVAMKEDTVRKRWGRILGTLQHLLQNFDSRAISRKAKVACS